MTFKLIGLFCLLNFLLFWNYKKISSLLNIYDIPDNFRKIHKQPVPLLGGFFLIINLILFLIIVEDKNYYNNLFFLLIIFLFFLVGILDDRFKIAPNYKLILTIFLLFLNFLFDDSAILSKLKFSFLQNDFDLGKYKIFISILCYLLFINAFNMIDGINGQAAFYAIFIFLILIFKQAILFFSIILIIYFIFFLYFNLRGLIFLGDGGSLSLAYLLSFILVKEYNLNHTFFADEIFLIMCIPGYDMLRLFFTRILKKRHPFLADHSHIHHLILKRFSSLKTLFINQLIFFLPYLSYLSFGNFYISLILSITIYSMLIYFFSRK